MQCRKLNSRSCKSHFWYFQVNSLVEEINAVTEEEVKDLNYESRRQYKALCQLASVLKVPITPIGKAAESSINTANR